MLKMTEETSPTAAPLLAALLCTTAISLAPNLLLYLFPTLTTSNSNSNDPQALATTKYWLTLGQCLAAGGLLGDVFLHTLPHSVMDIYANAQSEKSEEGHDHHDHGHEEHHGHSHGHDHHDHEFESQMMVLGMAILLGFTVFFVFDCVVRTFGAHHHHSGDEKDKKTQKEQDFSLSLVLSSPAILLNLTADALHNFTDGIAIGASFATAASTIDLSQDASLLDQITTLLQSRGGLASLAIFLHEVPHELGDFSILLDSGMSQAKAIQVQFLTALAAYAGTFFGYGLLDVIKHGSHGGNIDVLVPFTAGGFIYLACGTILPGVLANEDDHDHEKNEDEARKGKRTSQFKNRIGQILAFGVGVGFMYLVATLEHAGGNCCHGHLDLSLEDHTHDHTGHSHGSVHHHEVHSHEESHGHDGDHHHCCDGDHHHDEHIFTSSHSNEQEL